MTADMLYHIKYMRVLVRWWLDIKRLVLMHSFRMKNVLLRERANRELLLHTRYSGLCQ